MISFQKSCCVCASVGILMENRRGDALRLQRLRVHVGERRDVIVPLDQRRDAPEAAHGLRVEIPDRIGDRMVMGVV